MKVNEGSSRFKTVKEGSRRIMNVKKVKVEMILKGFRNIIVSRVH